MEIKIFGLIFVVLLIGGCGQKNTLPLAGTSWSLEQTDMSWVFEDREQLIITQHGYYEINNAQEVPQLTLSDMGSYVVKAEGDTVQLFLQPDEFPEEKEAVLELDYSSGENGFLNDLESFQGIFWDSENHMMEICFEEDGTYRANTYYKYDISDKTFTLQGTTGKTVYDYIFNEQDQKLTLKYGDELELILNQQE